jgi:hypothetical protein
VRGRTGLLATVGPVAAGLLVGCAWNLAFSAPRHAAEDGPGVSVQVGQSLQQAAEQPWARASQGGGGGGHEGTRPARSG